MRRLRPTLRRLGIALLGFSALGCPFALEPVPEISRFELDLAAVRGLGADASTLLPLHVEVFIANEKPKPAAGVFGGIRFDRVVFVWTSFRIVYPDRYMIVDAPPDSPEVQRSLLGAERILVTHEHSDHIGGILDSPQRGNFGDRLLLTTEQCEDVDCGDLTPSFTFSRYHRLSPGVVLIRAPGHTRGSQIVYIRLANGRELLLVGDIAWHRLQFERPAGRPRVSSWLMGEDPQAVGHQLRKLHALSRETTLDVVVSHDREQLHAYIASGVLRAPAACSQPLNAKRRPVCW